MTSVPSKSLSIHNICPNIQNSMNSRFQKTHGHYIITRQTYKGLSGSIYLATCSWHIHNQFAKRIHKVLATLIHSSSYLPLGTSKFEIIWKWQRWSDYNISQQATIPNRKEHEMNGKFVLRDEITEYQLGGTNCFSQSLNTKKNVLLIKAWKKDADWLNKTCKKQGKRVDCCFSWIIWIRLLSCSYLHSVLRMTKVKMQHPWT